MRTTLTENAVRAAQSGCTLWDGSLKHFGLRVAPGGTKSFLVLLGSGRRQAIGRYPEITLAQARIKAKRILAERTLGRHQTSSVGWQTAIEKFLEARRSAGTKERTVDEYRSHFGFPNFFVPLIAPTRVRMDSMMALLLRMTRGRGSKMFLFKTFPVFSSAEKAPRANGHMLTEPWSRAGFEPLSLTAWKPAPHVDKCAKIIELNDELRTTFKGGRVQMTRGVYDLDDRLRGRALSVMARYKKFDDGSEHDCGVFIFAGYSFEWRIEYRGKEGNGVSPDPADPEKTFRVLTLYAIDDVLV